MQDSQTKTRRDGRFFRRRVNCEQVPLLPAWAVGWMLDDPRKIPYLLVWRSDRDGQVKEALRVARYCNARTPSGDNREMFCVHREALPCDWVTVKRTDGSYENICAVLRPLPRNGGTARLLICPYCQLRVRGSMDGRWMDGVATQAAHEFVPGNAALAPRSATLLKVVRSCFEVAGRSFV